MHKRHTAASVGTGVGQWITNSQSIKGLTHQAIKENSTFPAIALRWKSIEDSTKGLRSKRRILIYCLSSEQPHSQALSSVYS